MTCVLKTHALNSTGIPQCNPLPNARDRRRVRAEIPSVTRKRETIATLPGGWDLAHATRLGIKPFAELGANSEALSGSQVDSPCSCRAIFDSAPVAMLQSLKK